MYDLKAAIKLHNTDWETELGFPVKLIIIERLEGALFRTGKDIISE